MQDLGLVLVPGGGGAVGVQDQGPAPAVDHDLVVEPAKKDAVLDGRGAAVRLVPGVVHLAAPGGLVAPPGPLAVPVPQDDRVADPRGDGLAVPDVQRQARPAQAGAELAAAQEARQPAGAGQQVDGLADDGLLDRRPGRIPGSPSRGGAGPARRTAGPGRPARPGDVAGHDRGHRRVTGDRPGGVTVQPGPGVPAAFGRGRAVPGPPRPDLRRPFVPAAPSCRPAGADPPARYAPTLSPAARPARAGYRRRSAGNTAAVILHRDTVMFFCPQSQA